MKKLIFLLLLIWGCNRVDWIPIVDQPAPFEKRQFEIQGKYCTEKSTQINYPVKVLFLIDGSVSMEVNDPPNPQTKERGRQKAFREFWENLYLNPNLQAQSQNTYVGLVRFSAQAQVLTGGDIDGDGAIDSVFTQDPELLRSATTKLEFTDRTTNYINILSTAYSIIRSESLAANEASLPLTSYKIYFLSDGLPSDGVNGAQGSNEDQIKTQLEDLSQLKAIFNIGTIEFNTLYLSSIEGLNQDEQAQELLQNMATWGNGSYRSIVGGENLNFSNFGQSQLQRLYSLKSFFALPKNLVQSNEQLPLTYIEDWDQNRFIDGNQNGEIDCGEPLLDSDEDGLSDLFEIRIGTEQFLEDSDGDGLRDRVEWENRRSGLSPLDPSDGKCDSVADEDGDGLNDCEELFLGTLKQNVDSDGDGLSDALEFRFATSPHQMEGRNDLDWDGVSNFDEVMGGFDPFCNDSSIRSRVGYSKQLKELGTENAQNCYSFSIIQMPALARENAEGELVTQNKIELYAGEGAFDESDDISLWKKACIDIDFSLDQQALDQQYFELKADDFKSVTETLNCIRSKERMRNKYEP